MTRALSLACVLCTSLVSPGGGARHQSVVAASDQRWHAEAQSEEAQGGGSGIWIFLALQRGGRRHGSGGATYYEPPDRGCAAIENASYPAICSGMSSGEWECEPRTLEASGTKVQANVLNENSMCPVYVACSCKKVDYSGDYTSEMCRSRGSVDHKAFLQPIIEEICPAYIEACEEDCDSSWSPESCKQSKCTLEACSQNFPRYTPEFMSPYTKKKDVGCWGRLKGNGQLGKTVLRSIAEYESLAKCCYHQSTDGGPREFKWCSGNELVKTWRPDKWIRGRKVCNTDEGWHSANHLGVDASTQEKCEALQ